MIGGFLTVEDINSILKEYGNKNIFHIIDTSLITSDSDFDNIKYDFCTIERTTNGNDYTFNIKVENSIWTGGYYLTKTNGEYLSATVEYNDSTHILTIVTPQPAIQIHFHLCNIAWSFTPKKLHWKPLDFGNVTNLPQISTEHISDAYPPVYFELLDDSITPASVVVLENEDGQQYGNFNLVQTEISNIYQLNLPFNSHEGSKKATLNNNSFYFMNNVLKNVPLRFHLHEGIKIISTLIVGKVNHISLVRISDFVDTGVVSYLGKRFNIDIADGFDVDLTNKTDLTSIKVSLHTNAKNGFYDWDYDFVLPCEIFKPRSYYALSNECGDGGTSVIELGGNITLTSDITITHDIKIDGKGKTINLNGHGFVLKEGVSVTLENILFNNGDTAILQQKNTDLTLNNCSFTYCSSSKYNGLGSCIYCEIDTESLNNPNDFKTIIDNCTFTDNQNCILHGGKLTVTNSKYHNTDTDYIDKHNVAFLYQTDGRATLKYNIFDIDYDTDTLCTNESNIGFAQALIQCGLTARINGADSTQLLEDNKLPFSDSVYQNTSHVFAKYYYPQIEACVYTSPIVDKEDKAVCYTVTGENWIFKQNVQVTRASWDTQNEVRKIEWEE